MSFHWRDFLWKISSSSRGPGRKRVRNLQPALNSESSESAEQSDDDDDQSDHLSDDSSGISGHYSFQHNRQQCDCDDLDNSSSSQVSHSLSYQSQVSLFWTIIVKWNQKNCTDCGDWTPHRVKSKDSHHERWTLLSNDPLI